MVRFSSVETCSVEAVEGRCEAGMDPGEVAFSDACDPATRGGLYGSLQAIVETRELVQMHALSGPIGAGTALVNQQTDVREVHSCGADAPAPPAALCACTDVACSAR